MVSAVPFALFVTVMQFALGASDTAVPAASAVLIKAVDSVKNDVITAKARAIEIHRLTEFLVLIPTIVTLSLFVH